MPKGWYERNANKSVDVDGDDCVREFNLRIIADKKPYFMRYIYPSLMKQYNTYITNTNKKAIREFRLTIEELLDKADDVLTDDEREFIHYYHAKMPVGLHGCVMNRICKRFEDEFDGYIARHSSDFEFDYNIMKSGQEYTVTQYSAIQQLYSDYIRRTQDYMQYAKKERIDDHDNKNALLIIRQSFEQECFHVCSSGSQLCDILLDVCYQKEDSKQFAWEIAGSDIVENLLNSNDRMISFPVADENGDVVFSGEKFSFITKRLDGDNSEYRTE